MFKTNDFVQPEALFTKYPLHRPSSSNKRCQKFCDTGNVRKVNMTEIHENS